MNLHVWALGIVFLFSILLVFYEHYEDGLCGRIALLIGIAMPSGIWLLEEWGANEYYDVANGLTFMFFGFAFFLGRTLYNAWRYRRRVLMSQRGPEYERRSSNRRLET